MVNPDVAKSYKEKYKEYREIVKSNPGKTIDMLKEEGLLPENLKCIKTISVDLQKEWFSKYHKEHPEKFRRPAVSSSCEYCGAILSDKRNMPKHQRSDLCFRKRKVNISIN